MDHLTDDNPLMNAARRGDAERVAALIAEGADVNAQSEAGFFALQLACANSCTECVKVRWRRMRRRGVAGADMDAVVGGGKS